MERPYVPPKILRLVGVTVAENYHPIEDEADQRLREEANDSPPSWRESTSDLAADKIPQVFTGLEDWPYQTNLKCWMCDCTFADRPKFVPTFVRVNGDNALEIGVLGNMCTFNCAELWIETHQSGRASNEERWRAQDNLCLVYFLFTGRRTDRIKPAISKTERRQYGGDLDDDTFWQRMRELDPVAGLRDYTPGSIVQERDRVRDAVDSVNAKSMAKMRSTPIATQDKRGERGSVWGVCDVQKPDDSVAIASPDSLDDFIDSLLDGTADDAAAAEMDDAAADDAAAETDDAADAADEAAAADETDEIDILAEFGLD